MSAVAANKSMTPSSGQIQCREGSDEFGCPSASGQKSLSSPKSGTPGKVESTPGVSSQPVYSPCSVPAYKALAFVVLGLLQPMSNQGLGASTLC
jgi:hypothetical protein